jgi:cation diffusion facilitator family transporter
LVVAIILGMTGVWIGIDAISHVVTTEYFVIPGTIALAAAVAGIVIKEGMFWYVRAAAKKINSDALMADAWHSRSDGLSSIGSLLGILGARAGFPVLDSLAGVVICAFIIKVSVDIAKSALGKLTDHACDADTLAHIQKIILNHDEVKRINRLQSRISGNRIYVDADISLDGTLSFAAAHAISDSIHDIIELEIPGVKHCMIHAEPHTKVE